MLHARRPRTLATHALSIFGDHSGRHGVPPDRLRACWPRPRSRSARHGRASWPTLHAREPRALPALLRWLPHVARGRARSQTADRTTRPPRALVRREHHRGAPRARPDPGPARASGARHRTPTRSSRPARRATLLRRLPDHRPGARDGSSFERVTGRRYKLVEYHGHPQAERVVVIMGSGADTARETVDWLSGRARRAGRRRDRCGCIAPSPWRRWLRAKPRFSVRRIAVLDRTKEPGAVGEPLYLRTSSLTLLAKPSQCRARLVRSRCSVVDRRAGTASRPRSSRRPWWRRLRRARTASEPRMHFTVGIVDDVTNLSLDGR